MCNDPATPLIFPPFPRAPLKRMAFCLAAEFQETCVTDEHQNPKPAPEKASTPTEPTSP